MTFLGTFPPQVVGYKRVVLFPAEQTKWLYPKEAGGGGVDAQGNVSAVDVEAPATPDTRNHASSRPRRVCIVWALGWALRNPRGLLPDAAERPLRGGEPRLLPLGARPRAVPRLRARRGPRGRPRAGGRAVHPGGLLAPREEPHRGLLGELLVLSLDNVKQIITDTSLL